MVMTLPTDVFFPDDLQALAEVFGRVSSRISSLDSRQDRFASMDLVRRATALLKARRRRMVQFGESIGALLGDPAYDMLLDLYVADRTGKMVTVSSACLATGGPSTTELRYIARLIEAGAIVRKRDPSDRRSSHVSITPVASKAVERHLRSLEI